jgi:hypothetical protein
MIYHCINHLDRPAAVGDKCWSCFLGYEDASIKMGIDIDKWYEELLQRTDFYTATNKELKAGK